MDRDIYNVILDKIADVGELINSIGGDTSDLETTVQEISSSLKTISGAVETLQSHDTISVAQLNSYKGFSDSKTGCVIAISTTNNKLLFNDGTNEYYFTLTPYTT